VWDNVSIPLRPDFNMIRCNLKRLIKENSKIELKMEILYF